MSPENHLKVMQDYDTGNLFDAEQARIIQVRLERMERKKKKKRDIN